MNSPYWLQKALIYQIFTGRWEAEISGNQILKINKFNDLKYYSWQNLIELGFNCFYFLGIWQNNGPILVQNENGKNLPSSKFPRVPSLFALSNHKQINSAFGAETDFKSLISTMHDFGAKIIVDFIPNHTSQNHPWVSSHPDYYQWQDGKIIAEFSGDVFKLNYANPNLETEMIQVLQYIQNLGVDGVRCDMAHLVPISFWQKTISLLKSHNPDFAFLAEAYPNSIFDYTNIIDLYNSGFDAIYNNSLFENIYQVICKNAPLSYLVESIKAAKKNQPKLIINYFSNHDDPTLDNKEESEEKLNLANKYQEALIALTLFLPDIAFFFNGSLLGKHTRLAHHWFEPLERKYLETENSIPENITKLFYMRKQINNLEIKNIYEEKGLLIIENSSFRLVINLSPNSVNYQETYLNPGKIYIFNI